MPYYRVVHTRCPLHLSYILLECGTVHVTGKTHKNISFFGGGPLRGFQLLIIRPVIKIDAGTIAYSGNNNIISYQQFPIFVFTFFNNLFTISKLVYFWRLLLLGDISRKVDIRLIKTSKCRMYARLCHGIFYKVLKAKTCKLFSITRITIKQIFIFICVVYRYVFSSQPFFFKINH